MYFITHFFSVAAMLISSDFLLGAIMELLTTRFKTRYHPSENIFFLSTLSTTAKIGVIQTSHTHTHNSIILVGKLTQPRRIATLLYTSQATVTECLPLWSLAPRRRTTLPRLLPVEISQRYYGTSSLSTTDDSGHGS